MELKESCEKYADHFILKAYDNGGSISNTDFKLNVPKEYEIGVMTLLKFHGSFFNFQGCQSYTLSKDGMEFARKGAFSGVIKREMNERKHNKQTRYIAISSLIISVLVAIKEIFIAILQNI